MSITLNDLLVGRMLARIEGAAASQNQIAHAMTIVIREMTVADYDAVMALLTAVEGVGLRSADSRENITRYLERNPGTSFVAVAGEQIAGCIFGGHDGRRGYLYHLAVANEARRKGLARRLVQAAIEAISRDGVNKFHADVFTHNALAQAVWRRLGWEVRSDLVRISFVAAADPNA